VGHEETPKIMVKACNSLIPHQERAFACYNQGHERSNWAVVINNIQYKKKLTNSRPFGQICFIVSENV